MKYSEFLRRFAEVIKQRRPRDAYMCIYLNQDTYCLNEYERLAWDASGLCVERDAVHMGRLNKYIKMIEEVGRVAFRGWLVCDRYRAVGDTFWDTEKDESPALRSRWLNELADAHERMGE